MQTMNTPQNNAQNYSYPYTNQGHPMNNQMPQNQPPMTEEQMAWMNSHGPQGGGYPPQQGGQPMPPPMQGGYPPQMPPQQGGQPMPPPMPPQGYQQGGRPMPPPMPPQGFPQQQGGRPMPPQGHPQQQGGYPPQNQGPSPQEVNELIHNFVRMAHILQQVTGKPAQEFLGGGRPQQQGGVRSQTDTGGGQGYGDTQGVFHSGKPNDTNPNQSFGDSGLRGGGHHDTTPTLSLSRQEREELKRQSEMGQGNNQQPQQPQNQQPQQSNDSAVMESLEPDGSYVDTRSPNQRMRDEVNRANQTQGNGPSIVERFNAHQAPPNPLFEEGVTHNRRPPEPQPEPTQQQDMSFKVPEFETNDSFVKAEAVTDAKVNDDRGFHLAYDPTKSVSFYIVSKVNQRNNKPYTEQLIMKKGEDMDYLNHELDVSFYNKTVDQEMKHKIVPRFDLLNDLDNLPEPNEDGDIDDIEKIKSNAKPIIKDTVDFAYSMDEALWQRDLWHHNNELSEKSVSGNNEFYYENTKSIMLFDTNDTDMVRLWLSSAGSCETVDDFHEMLVTAYETQPERLWHLINDACTKSLNRLLSSSSGEDFAGWFIDSFAVDWPEVAQSMLELDASGSVLNTFKTRFRKEILLGGLRVLDDRNVETFANCLQQNFAASEIDVKKNAVVLTQLHSVTQINCRASDLNIKIEPNKGSIVKESQLPELHKAIEGIEKRVSKVSSGRSVRKFIRTLDNVVIEIQGALYDKNTKIIRHAKEFN